MGFRDYASVIQYTDLWYTVKVVRILQKVTPLDIHFARGRLWFLNLFSCKQMFLFTIKCDHKFEGNKFFFLSSFFFDWFVQHQSRTRKIDAENRR